MNPQPNFPRNFRDWKQYQIAFGRKFPGQLVGVIADPAALQNAIRLRQLPDFFEVRLDALRDRLEEIEEAIPRLNAPLIFTARHPAEGGCGALSAATRGHLLERFLDCADCIDLELRSAKIWHSLGKKIGDRKILLLLSRHDLQTTPSPNELADLLQRAIDSGAQLFKIVTRTDNAAQLDRLLTFYNEHARHFPIAAMGTGKLGPESRRILLRRSSALNYGSLGNATAEGQPSLAALRRIR